MKILLFIISFLFAFSCNTSKQITKKETTPSISESILFEKFVGNWENKTFGIFEKWEKINNDQFAALAFSVQGQDTIVQETVNIYKEADKWIYEVTVKGQNNGKAVKFTADNYSENQINFSNPSHDFPTDINYSFEENTMKAFIAGPEKNGEIKKIPIIFERLEGR